MSILYDYNRLMNEVSWYSNTGSIGKSVMGREIPYIFIGKRIAPQVILVGSTHAREHITTSLVMLLAKKFNREYNPALHNFGVHFIPSLNVDGVEMCIMYDDYKLYKENSRGVDINNNFPALWGRNKTAKKGGYPASEAETMAIMNYTKKVRCKLAIAYHSKGEVIYYDFNLKGERLKTQKKLGGILSKSTGYKLVKNGNSVGGYKDWCIDSLHIPAFTVEVGSDKLSHPILSDNLDLIFNQNKNVFNDIKNILYY